MSEQVEPLSEREIEVLDLLVKGASNREIADTLIISPNTVKVHLRNIYTKLGVSSRTEATTTALQQGLVLLPNMAAPITTETSATPAAAVEATPSAPESVTAPFQISEPDHAPDTIPHLPVAHSRRWIWASVMGALGLALFVFLVARLPAWLAAITPTSQPIVTPVVPQSVDEDNHWLVGVELPTAQVGLVLAAVGLDLYAIGGEGEAGISGRTYIYRPNAATWEIGADKPTPVTDAAAVVLFGEIYVVGGQQADGTVTNRVEVYSPANQAWRPAAALPQPLSGGLALTDGSFLYLFGGWNGADYLAESFLYDPSADTWRPLPDMATPRAFSAGGFLTGEFYVVGGLNETGELADCEQFEADTQDWAECPAMLSPRGGAAAAIIVNQLYIFGGGLENEVTFGEAFDPTTETWQVINMPILTERGQWVHFGLTSVETKVYLVGGRDADTLFTNTYIYERFPFRAFIPAASTSD